MGEKLKIAIYGIAKNEEKFIKRMCDSAAGADYIVIADTGSTDNTVGVAKECGALVYTIGIAPFRFDHARNAALALVPMDADVCVSMDMDEVLEPGWREEIEKQWVKGKTTRMRSRFTWGPGITFYYEKIHARAGYHWHHPCHEYPRPDPRTREKRCFTEKVLVTHYPDPEKSRSQYMGLLEVGIQEDPHCPRNTFYYARELTFNERWEEAVEYLNKYLDMPDAVWKHERAYAMRLLGQSFDKLGRPDESIMWYRRACAELPNARESWGDLADVCYRRQEWAECMMACQKALSITVGELVYTVNPELWGYKLHDLYAISAYNLGLYDRALEQGELALAFRPDDLRLQQNMVHYRAKSPGGPHASTD